MVARSVYRMPEARKRLARVILNPFRPEPAPVQATPQTPLEAAPGSFRSQVDDFEKKRLRAALAAARFNQKSATAAAGLGYHPFRNALRKHGLLDRK